jgi:hypothetical protein
MTEDEQLKRILEALERIEKKVDSLPCRKGKCPI